MLYIYRHLVHTHQQGIAGFSASRLVRELRASLWHRTCPVPESGRTHSPFTGGAKKPPARYAPFVACAVLTLGCSQPPRQLTAKSARTEARTRVGGRYYMVLHNPAALRFTMPYIGGGPPKRFRRICDSTAQKPPLACRRKHHAISYGHDCVIAPTTAVISASRSFKNHSR